MDEFQKLLKKIHEKEKLKLLEIILLLKQKKFDQLDIKKLVNSLYYRVRTGNFRIIYFIDNESGTVVIESVKRRNEKTYE